MADVHYALWGLCLLLVLLGLWGLALFFGGFKRLFHGHMASGGSRIVFGLLFLFVFAFAAAVALDLRTYLRLTYERPVATLSFAAVGPQDFRATLTDATGQVRSLELRGDDWQLDARVLKWKGMATVLSTPSLSHVTAALCGVRSLRRCAATARSVGHGAGAS